MYFLTSCSVTQCLSGRGKYFDIMLGTSEIGVTVGPHWWRACLSQLALDILSESTFFELLSSFCSQLIKIALATKPIMGECPETS